MRLVIAIWARIQLLQVRSTVIALSVVALPLAVIHAAQEPVENTLRIVELKGSAYERGRLHGAQLRSEIHALIQLWKDDLRKSFRLDPDEFITAFFRNTHYIPALEKWTPELLQEIKGISDGCGVNFETAFVYQLVDEYWARGQMDGEHCSSVGVSPAKGKPALLGQNLDLESFRDRYQTILRTEDENGLKTMVVTFPGYIGAGGVNNKGVAVVANTLDQLMNSNDGLPVACVVRGILLRTNLNAVTDFLKTIKHASGQNYLVGTPGSVADFECSSTKVAQYGEGQKVLGHTNHALKNDDYTENWRKLLKENPDPLRDSNSRVRFQSLASRFGGLTGTPSIHDLKTILRSKDSPQFPVCRPQTGRGAFTFASVLIVLNPVPELQITSGPPDQSEYRTLRF